MFFEDTLVGGDQRFHSNSHFDGDKIDISDPDMYLAEIHIENIVMYQSIIWFKVNWID